MVDFKNETRKRCRHCKMRLPEPTSNERQAFCTRGCYRSFYLHKCRVCEKPIEQPKHGTRLLCKKPKCQNAWQRQDGMGRYATVKLDKGVGAIEAKPSSEMPANQAVLSASKPVEQARKPWHQIAGPALTGSQLHCATVPEGEIVDGKPTWDGGSYERIEAQNRKALKAHFANLKAAEDAEIEANGYFTDPEWREVISPDGVLCYVTRFRPATTVKSERHIPDDLSIPPFLDRRPRPEQLREAA
jgi:hypothetical protein